MARSWRCSIVGSLLVFLLTGSSPVAAQDSGDTDNAIVIGYRHSIYSKVLEEERSIWVHTPEGYVESSIVYPVLYVLDGSSHLHHTSGVVQFLSANNRIPSMIVVAIPNTTDRTRDLTPPMTMPDTADQFPTAGGADNFLRFLREELQPWVEREYRTAPYNILIGHSFGGLFATHTLLNEPETFDAYLAISPSLWWDDETWIEKAEHLFDHHPNLKGSLYMTMANEGGNMLAGAWGLTRILETSAPDSFDWEWKLMEAEDHGSIPHPSTYDGLEWLFRGWQMPDFFQVVMDGGDEGMERVDRHYADLTARFGFTVRAPEGSMNRIGYYLLQQKRTEDAIRVFESNVRRYPESANTYDSLGDAYDAACRLEEARENYTRAYRIAIRDSRPNAETYKEHLDKVTEKIEKGDCTVR